MDCLNFVAGMLTSWAIQGIFKVACKCKESCGCSCFDGLKIQIS